jgi:hypothetical protein
MKPTNEKAKTITIHTGMVAHTMRGGLGASWHAIGPTAFHYPDVIGRDNRACRGSAFGGNPPLLAGYQSAWRDLLHHARWLGLDFIRVEIDMRMYHPQRDLFTWDNEEMQTLERILQHCQSNDVDVYFSMMWQDVDWNAHPGVSRLQSAPRSVEDFAESYSALLERLIQAKGYSCIRWVTVSNEPGFPSGWWNGPDRQPASITPAIHAVRAALDRKCLQDVAVCGPDSHSLRMGQFDPQDPAAGALGIHDYNGAVPLEMYREGVRIARERGIPFFVAEFGRFFMGEFEGEKMAMGGPRSEAPKSYEAQLLNAEKVLVGLNEGVDGFNRWSFTNRGDLDGQWQLVRTWNPNLWDYYKEVKPEPVPYYCFGILSRFTAKHSSVLATACDDPDIVATTLRSPLGETTILILNKSGQERNVAIELAGLTAPLEFCRYGVTKAGVEAASFALTPQATVAASPAQSRMDILLPLSSITAFTTVRFADDIPAHV